MTKQTPRPGDIVGVVRNTKVSPKMYTVVDRFNPSLLRKQAEDSVGGRMSSRYRTIVSTVANVNCVSGGKRGPQVWLQSNDPEDWKSIDTMYCVAYVSHLVISDNLIDRALTLAEDKPRRVTGVSSLMCDSKMNNGRDLHILESMALPAYSPEKSEGVVKSGNRYYQVGLSFGDHAYPTMPSGTDQARLALYRGDKEGPTVFSSITAARKAVMA